MIYTQGMGSFRENLRDELDFQGLTVKELAARTGIIKGSLDNYLGARASMPPADVAVRIAQALNVSVEYLVTGQEASESPSSSRDTQSRSIHRELSSIPPQLQTLIRSLIHEAALLSRKKGHEA